MASEFYKRQVAQHLTIVRIKAIGEAAEMPMERLHFAQAQKLLRDGFPVAPQ